MQGDSWTGLQRRCRKRPEDNASEEAAESHRDLLMSGQALGCRQKYGKDYSRRLMLNDRECNCPVQVMVGMHKVKVFFS